MPRMAENAKPSANLLKRLKTIYVFVRFEHESLYLFCIGFWVLCHFWHMGDNKNWPLRKTQRKTTQEVEENDIHKSAFSKKGERSKTDPSAKPTAKLLKELKKMIYIKMHFQIRNQAKLSETRSQLYRKLWYWSKAYSLQNCPLYKI